MALCHSAIFHICRLGGIYYFLQALGYKSYPPEVMITMSLAAIASLLPLSLGVLGIRESSFAMGLGIYGVDFTTTINTAMLVRLILWAQAATGGIIMVCSRNEIKV